MVSYGAFKEVAHGMICLSEWHRGFIFVTSLVDDAIGDTDNTCLLKLEFVVFQAFHAILGLWKNKKN